MKHPILLPDRTIGWTEDISLWAKQMEDISLRMLGNDTWGEVQVSTVFIGYAAPHDVYNGSAFFETVIFGGELDQYQERYKTYKEALAGHLHNLQLIRTYRMEGEVWSE